MNRRDRKRGLLLVLLVVSMVLVSSCSMMSSKTPAKTNYYTGYRGSEIEIVQSMPPDKLFYYSDMQDNTFDVQVKVDNKGSSWTRGAVFVSGYDPSMISIAGITPDPSQARACRLNIGNIGFGRGGVTVSCQNFFAGAGEGGYVDVGFRNLFGEGGLYANLFDQSRIFGSGVDLRYQQSGDDRRFTFDFDNPTMDFEYANHGRLMISLLQAIDFSTVYGQEYLLEGNTYEYPGGGMEYINFDANIVSWPPGLDKTDQKFMITNCFLYTTYAAPIVCIDPSPYSENKKVCTAKSYSGTSGQGAPVTVSAIEQENTPRQAVFTIHIRNTGGGRVFDPGMISTCSPYSPVRITNEELNVVYVGDIRVSGELQRLKCTPNDFVRLDPKTGEGIVTCAFDIPYSGLRSAYQAPLVVELWYGYEKTLQKTVTIKRAV